MAVVVATLAIVVASRVSASGQPFSWHMVASVSAAAWQRWDSGRQVFPVLQVLLFLALALGLQWHRMRARLVLDDRSLRYACGLPVVWRWLDWQLDLNALRSGAVTWQLTGASVPANPLATLRLTWSPGARQGLWPARWYLPDEPEPRDVASPHSVFGLVLWNSARNLPVVQQRYEALPLVRALRDRGVPVPIPGGQRGGAAGGRDLLAYPRMKAVIFGFFVALAVAAALFHATRHQHYFVVPPVGLWFAVGAVTGLIVLAWLWPEGALAHGSTTPTAAERAGFRATQWVVAALAAVSAGLCAPWLPLALTWAGEAPRTVVFTVALPATASPRVMLQPRQAPDVPPVELGQALDFWLSLRREEALELPVRRGLGGLWWQFDSRVLEERMDRFHGRR